MPSPALRFVSLALLLLVGGCSTAPKWPEPQNTTDIVLQDDRRDVITTVSLGDALHLVLPPPTKPNTQWQILTLNTIAIRQMTDLKAVAGRPGSEEVSFQAIKTTARTVIRFAAIESNAAYSTPDDFFAISVGIKQQSVLIRGRAGKQF